MSFVTKPISAIEHEQLGVKEREDFSLRPPFIVNEDIIPAKQLASMKKSWVAEKFRGRPVRIYRLHDVIVAGQGLVLTKDMEVVQESVTQHSVEEIERIIQDVSSRTDFERVDGEALLLRKRGEQNYGHWLVECLPKVLMAAEFFTPELLVIPSVGEGMNRVISDSLELVDYGAIPRLSMQEGECRLFSKLVIVDGLTSHGSYMSPDVRHSLEAMRGRTIGAGQKKILMRRTNLNRSISNENELAERLAQHGFISVDPIGMTLEQQISALHDAEVVVGAMGAAMTNIAFATSGAKIINISPAVMPDTFFYFLASIRDQIYMEMRCPIDDEARGRHSNFTVDVDAVVQKLNELKAI